MAPHFTAPLILIPIVLLGVWRRVRTQFGLQPIRRTRMMIRVAIFSAITALVALYALRSVPLITGLASGLVGGAVLGFAGLRLTRFQIDPVKGDCYLPNPYIGAFITVMFLARLLWRYAMVMPQLQDSAGATPLLHGPDIGQSPLTLAILGLLLGYYVCYFAGLLIHHQRVLRERPSQPV